jgi:hypothetical protein
MQVFAFLGIRRGRWFRGTVGGALALASLLWLRGPARVVLVALGTVEVVGAVLNLCALAPLFGGHLDARKNVAEYGPQRYQDEI